MSKPLVKLPTESEKRNYQRLDVEIPVELNIDGQTIPGNTANISCGGMFLPHPPQSDWLDKIFTCSIFLPDKSNAVQINGRIARVQSGEEQGMAVQFDGLYNESRLEIDSFIKRRLMN